jgi:hypothetical protein
MFVEAFSRYGTANEAVADAGVIRIAPSVKRKNPTRKTTIRSLFGVCSQTWLVRYLDQLMQPQRAQLAMLVIHGLHRTFIAAFRLTMFRTTWEKALLGHGPSKREPAASEAGRTLGLPLRWPAKTFLNASKFQI